MRSSDLRIFDVYKITVEVQETFVRRSLKEHRKLPSVDCLEVAAASCNISRFLKHESPENGHNDKGECDDKYSATGRRQRIARSADAGALQTM
ncbi:unnamed protein product [Soboliphyme baturini]|uniref:Uncharacterized protein n=1 Tax=Soboliphyme baturini TaxID=241478 RepID=A0A183IGW7_9BILA|nr:unnamed protein product [Soboliphyme baturini]